MSEQRLSGTYRELATERTPKHLDRAVLAEAASAAKPRYSRLTKWTRPVAWAATVLLSVALVLEITRTPDAPAEKREAEFGAAAFDDQETDVLDQAEEIMEMRALEASEDAAFAPAGRARAEPGCDERATAAAESWLACIEELEAAGLVDEAARQRERLAQAFPAFVAD